MTPASTTIDVKFYSWNFNFNLDPFNTNSTTPDSFLNVLKESKASLDLYKLGLTDKSVVLGN